MTCNNSTIFVKKGDDSVITVTFLDSSGAAINITGATVFLTVKEKLSNIDDDAVIAIDQTTHTDPTHGITQITIDSTTSASLDEKNYFYDIRLKQSGGLISTTDTGIFNVSQTVTRRTS